MAASAAGLTATSPPRGLNTVRTIVSSSLLTLYISVLNSVSVSALGLWTWGTTRGPGFRTHPYPTRTPLAEICGRSYPTRTPTVELFGAHERSPDPANQKYRLVTRMRESRCTFHWLFPVFSRSSESTPPVPTRPKGTSATNNEDERQNAIQRHTTQQSARDYQFHPG